MATYMTVDAFAEEMDVDDMTVRRMVAAGQLKAIDIARPGAKRARLRIPVTELDRIGVALAVRKIGKKS